MKYCDLIIENGVLKKLKDVDGSEIVIPEGVVEIWHNAFNGCKKLERAILPQSLLKIGMYAFAGCSALSEIDIPNSVESIGNGAFAGTALENIIIPRGVTRLNCNLFNECSALKTVYIPNSVRVAFDDALVGCENAEVYMEAEPTSEFANRTEYIRTYDHNGDSVTQEIKHGWNPFGRPVHTNVSRAEYERIVALCKK